MCEIEICLGSSCFARGNAENLKLLREYLAARGIAAAVSTTGHLCRDHCKLGPNLAIDGKLHHGVSAAALKALLDARFGEGGVR